MTELDKEADEEGVEELVDALLEGQLIATLVHNLNRMEEINKHEADGVHNTLGVYHIINKITLGMFHISILEQLESWIKVKVCESTSQNKQTDREISQGRVLSVNLFLVAIYGILREQGNGVDGSLFADDLAIYITRKQRALQGLTNKLDAWAAEIRLTFSTSNTVNMVIIKRKRNKEPMKITTRNQITPNKESKGILKHFQSGSRHKSGE